MSDAVLAIEDLTVSLPTESGMLRAVRGISLEIRRGETFCLVGESGCGKSVTALAVMGLLPRRAEQNASRFMVAGRDYAGLPPAARHSLRGREVAMIFQDPMTSLNPTLTIRRQMTEGVIYHEGLGRREAEERALHLLHQVGVPQPDLRLGQYPHQFSGGQRQRIMIAMALMGSPKLLIADEPTTALDVTIQAQILALLAELQEALHLTLLLITHDLGVVATIADRVAVMYAGRFVEQGSSEAIFGRPLHPYTQGLMGAIPVPGETPRGTPLSTIPGRVPDLVGAVSGCAFRNRCSQRQEACAEDPLPIFKASSSHEMECVLEPELALSR